MVREKKKSQKQHQIGNILFFVATAALLWLIIKLSANYTVTENLTINFEEAPADLLVVDGTQNIKVTLSTSGFELLNYYFKPVSKRKINISLEEVPLHKNGEGTYSFNTSYVKDNVASFLAMEPSKISFDESRIMINMEQLDSIKAKVVADIDLSYEKQYNRHGKIQISPDSVMIYGPQKKINTIDNIHTSHLSLQDVNTNIDVMLPLQLDEMMKADKNEVNVKINVEKYTEAIANVRINNPTDKKLRLFPDKVKIKYIVYLSDYNIINENSFKVNIDSADIAIDNSFLPVYLTDYPNNTRIISIDPKEVEYIIIEENED